MLKIGFQHNAYSKNNTKSVLEVESKWLAIIIVGTLLVLLVFLIAENNNIRNSNEKLNNTLVNLQNRTSNLEDELKQSILSQSILMPKGLDEHYEKIRGDEGQKLIERGDEGWLLFYGTQVLHDLGDYTYGAHFYEYYATVGVPCNDSLDSFSKEILDYINTTYSLLGGNISKASKLEIAYDWVYYFVSNVNDTETGFGRFPSETFVYRYGDCEDQAMALSFLLESYGYETALCMIRDENLTQYGSDGLYHSFCVVKKTDFDYNGTLITLDRYPQDGKSWIILDPAFNQKYGEDTEWFSEYTTESNTFIIPEEVWWDSLLIDYSTVLSRYQELGIE